MLKLSRISELLTHKPSDYVGIEVNALRELLPYSCPSAKRDQLLADVTEDEM